MDDSTVHRETAHEKIRHLRAILGRYQRVAVAFSGGVDSTVLLDNCCRVFRPENVIALHARSCLQSARMLRNARQVQTEHFAGSCSYLAIDCQPLDWPEFVTNAADRCYFCKKRTYGLLINEASRQGCDVLLDGTNTDDLSEHRPGLRALREYRMMSPLADASMSKADVREYAKNHGFINHDWPSDSCLATRIAAEEQITAEGMKTVESAEDFLLSLGFTGVRVRPKKAYVCVETQKNDLVRMVEVEIGEQVARYFQKAGLGPVFLGLKGR